MSDGDYERRGPREAELKRLGRIMADARAKQNVRPDAAGRETKRDA